MTKLLRLTLLCLLISLTSSISNFSLANNQADDNIPRVRLNFTMPNGSVRNLLLSFMGDNLATDNYDFGYDGLNTDKYPYDLNWMIDIYPCIIQGVGDFNNTKKYPLGLFMADNNNIQISLDSLENFETPIDVYIYDALLNTYTKINNSDYSNYINKGEYTDRFYLAFKDETTITSGKSLSTNSDILKNVKVQVFNNTKELYINSNSAAQIKSIEIVNTLGQTLMNKNINTFETKLRLNNINSNHIIVNIITDLGSISKQFMVL